MKTIKLSFTGVIIMIIVALSYSCKDKESPDISQAINPMWEYNFNVGLTTNIEPLISDDKVLFAYEKDLSSNDILIAIDKIKGEAIWEWSDFLSSEHSSFPPESPKYIYNNHLFFSIGSSNYGVNLAEGKTLWRNRETPSIGYVSGKNDKIYRVNGYKPSEIGYYKNSILEADINTGNWQEIFEVTGGDTLQQHLSVPAFYTNSKGEELLLMGNSAISLKTTDDPMWGWVTPHLIAYNKTKDTVEYSVQLYEPGLTNRVDWYPKVLGDKVYLTLSRGIACHNVASGERIWFFESPADFLFSGMLIAENGFIYANREGYPAALYCIDPETGRIVWEQPSAGTSSPIVYHKNVLYFVGGSTGKLHIVDANSGETLHLITAPSQFENENDFFNSAGCAIDKETDRLYVSSYSRAYCFPTFELE